MYFRSFPKIDYDVTGDGVTQTVTDIITRIAVRRSLTDRMSIFTRYDIKEEETPEMLAYELYDSAELHWIILLFNNYFDRYYEWPMSIRVLQRYTEEKYENADAVHHWEMPQTSGDKNVKIIIDDLSQYEASNRPEASSVSNFEYEVNLNEKRKSIKILSEAYVPTFIKEHKALL